MKTTNYCEYMPVYSQARYLDFSEFEGINDNIILDINTVLPEGGIIRNKNDGKTYILLDLEQPNRFLYSPGWECVNNANYYDKIYTINPYFVKYMNKALGKELYHYVFFPFTKKNIPPEQIKEYDVFYSGHHIPLLDPYFNALRDKGVKLQIVEGGVFTYEEKLIENAKSKMSLVHNYYHSINFANPDDNPAEIRKNTFDDHMGFTQHKGRVLEAAFSKSLMLCMKDQFNLIEDLFEENKHFLYVTVETVNDVVQDVLNNYDNYQQMIEDAYQHALNNYTTECLYHRLIDDLK